MKDLCLRTMKGNVITIFLQNIGYGVWLISVYIFLGKWYRIIGLPSQTFWINEGIFSISLYFASDDSRGRAGRSSRQVLPIEPLNVSFVAAFYRNALYIWSFIQQKTKQVIS